MFKLNQRGVIAHLFLILILGLGLVAGVYLIQHPQIFKPKATSEHVEWVQSNGDDPDNCVSFKDGKQVTSCPKVKFKINVPVQVTP